MENCISDLIKTRACLMVAEYWIIRVQKNPGFSEGEACFSEPIRVEIYD